MAGLMGVLSVPLVYYGVFLEMSRRCYQREFSGKFLVGIGNVRASQTTLAGAFAISLSGFLYLRAGREWAGEGPGGAVGVP